MVAEFQWSMHAYMYVPCKFVMGGPYWYRTNLPKTEKGEPWSPYAWSFSPCLYHGVSLHEHTHSSQDCLQLSEAKIKTYMHTQACNKRNSNDSTSILWGLPLHFSRMIVNSQKRSCLSGMVWSKHCTAFYLTMPSFGSVGLITPTLPNSNLAISSTTAWINWWRLVSV